MSNRTPTDYRDKRRATKVRARLLIMFSLLGLFELVQVTGGVSKLGDLVERTAWASGWMYCPYAPYGYTDTTVDKFRCGNCTTVCSGAVGACQANACVGGVCQVQNTTVACDDGNPCTFGEKCGSGSCGSGTAYTCTPGQCQMTSVCNGTGNCTTTNKPAATACNDADACTSADQCDGLGNCAGSTPNCDDAHDCTADSCTAGGGCTHTLKAAGTACTPDANTCTQDRCDGVSMDCTHPSSASGTACSDGKVCTSGDICNGSGACAGTVSCDDGNDCTADACDGSGACTHTPVAANAACSDKNACTTGEKCNATGTCTGGIAVVCGEQDCKSTTCTPANGCVTTPIDSGPCGGNACFGVGTCSSGMCSGAVGKDCSGLTNECRVGACDKVAGGCITTNVVNGTTCTLTDRCMESTTCAAGECKGTEKVCPPPGDCRVALCNSSTGDCESGAAPVGTACGATNPCLRNAACDATGQCGGDPAQDGTPCDVVGCATAAACYGGTCSCAPPVQSTPDMSVTTGGGGDSGCAMAGGHDASPLGGALLLLALAVCLASRRRAATR